MEQNYLIMACLKNPWSVEYMDYQKKSIPAAWVIYVFCKQFDQLRIANDEGRYMFQIVIMESFSKWMSRQSFKMKCAEISKAYSLTTTSSTITNLG